MARRICEVTKEMIVNSQIEEGQRITESYLSELFGVSRSPVREALRMLAYEGFVELTPYRGARVSVIKSQDIKNHYQLKAMFDGYSAYHAAQSFNEEDLETLEDTIRKMASHIAKQEKDGMARCNMEFHGFMLDAIGNKLLSQLYNSLSQNLKRYTELSLGDEKHWQEVIEEHKTIYEALVRNDALAAFEAAAQHSHKAMERVIEKIGKCREVLKNEN